MERAVLIATTGCGHAGPTTASGVLALATSGWVVTAAHAVSGSSSVEATLPDGTTRLAEVLSVDPRRDTAILRIPSRPVQDEHLAFGDLSVGDTGRLLGGTSGEVPFTVRQVAEITIDRIGDSPGHTRLGYELAAATATGDSGAGAWDDEERLVGIVFATSTDGSDSTWVTAGSEVERHLMADFGGTYACDPEVSRLVRTGPVDD